MTTESTRSVGRTIRTPGSAAPADDHADRCWTATARSSARPSRPPAPRWPALRGRRCATARRPVRRRVGRPPSPSGRSARPHGSRKDRRNAARRRWPAVQPRRSNRRRRTSMWRPRGWCTRSVSNAAVWPLRHDNASGRVTGDGAPDHGRGARASRPNGRARRVGRKRGPDRCSPPSASQQEAPRTVVERTAEWRPDGQRVSNRDSTVTGNQGRPMSPRLPGSRGDRRHLGDREPGSTGVAAVAGEPAGRPMPPR